MEPRLSTSTQWTPFPEELTQQIKEVFTSFFEEYGLEGQSFHVEGRIYAQELLLRVGLQTQNQLRQHNFEGSLQYKNEKESLKEIHSLIDFVGQTWQDYLEEPCEDENLPRQWQKTQFEKQEIYLRYTTVNTDLEKQADELLNQYEKKLVYGEASADFIEEEKSTEIPEEDSSSETSLH